MNSSSSRTAIDIDPPSSPGTLGTLVPIRRVLSDDSLPQRPTIWGFTNPLTVSWFFSVIGSEYCHTYFWIAKDLAWMQSWRHCSIFFGLSALGWSLLILFHSLRTLNWHELWNFMALFLWLFANFWWMLGEAHDYEYPDAPPISMAHTHSSARILQAALCWVLFYYMIILPFHLLPCSKEALKEYDDGALLPRLPCFSNFRQYENLHMAFWIAKDLAWNQLHLSMWMGSMVLTILIALDFIVISATTTVENATVDIVHFAVILIWVLGNSVWAYGDFFMEDYSEPMGMWSSASDAFLTARWYSSWILFVAIVPIFVMYGVWATLSLLGKLQPPADQSESILDWEPVVNELDTMILDEECAMCRDRDSSSGSLTSSTGTGTGAGIEMREMKRPATSLRAASSLLRIDVLAQSAAFHECASLSASNHSEAGLVTALKAAEASTSSQGVVQRTHSNSSSQMVAPSPPNGNISGSGSGKRSGSPDAGLWGKISRGLGIVPKERSNDKIPLVTAVSPSSVDIEELAIGLEVNEFSELLPHRD